jgi:hypothetical protein
MAAHAGVRRIIDRNTRLRRLHIRVRRYGAGTATPTREPIGAQAGTLSAIASVGSPIAALTALLVYFGWVRTTVQADQLGYDVSIVDMSIQDYVLKSVNVVYIPLILMLLVGVALRALHRRLVMPRLVKRRERRRLRWLARAFLLSWLLWLPVCLLLLLNGPPVDGFAMPLTLAATLLCALYGTAVRRRLEPTAGGSTGARTIVVVLLALALLWSTERVARGLGEAYAADILARPETLVAVTVFSAKDLAISGPGVHVSQVGGPDAAYSYRYEGFRMLQRSGDRYLLISQSADQKRSRVFVIQETAEIRLEFSR